MNTNMILPEEKISERQVSIERAWLVSFLKVARSVPTSVNNNNCVEKEAEIRRLLSSWTIEDQRTFFLRKETENRRTETLNLRTCCLSSQFTSRDPAAHDDGAAVSTSRCVHGCGCACLPSVLSKRFRCLFSEKNKRFRFLGLFSVPVLPWESVLQVSLFFTFRLYLQIERPTLLVRCARIADSPLPNSFLSMVNCIRNLWAKMQLYAGMLLFTNVCGFAHVLFV